MTLPMIAALRNASGRDRLKLKESASSLRSDPNDAEFDELVRLVEKHGGFASARNRAADCARAAKGLLLTFDNSPSREALLSAADYVVKRSF